MHTYIPTYLHTYIPTYQLTYIPTYIPTLIPTYLHTYLHTYIPTYLDAYIHTCMHACMHTDIHPSIHPYIHTRGPPHSHRGEGRDPPIPTGGAVIHDHDGGVGLQACTIYVYTHIYIYESRPKWLKTTLVLQEFFLSEMCTKHCKAIEPSQKR